MGVVVYTTTTLLLMSVPGNTPVIPTTKEYLRMSARKKTQKWAIPRGVPYPPWGP